MREAIEFITLILGIFGMAGAIETDSNPIPALISLVIALVLITGDLRNDKKTDSKRDSSINRPTFLH